MFDETPPQDRIARDDWQTTLAIGDVVRYRFPLDDGDTTTEGAKARPCLVLETPRIGQRRYAKLAYGTGSTTRANRGCEVAVNRPDSLSAAGLDRPTRFVGRRSIIVQLDDPRFEPDPSGSPVVGSLDPELQARMHEVRARLHAEADMAAEERRIRRAERRRWEKEGRRDAARNRRMTAGREAGAA